MEKIKIGTIVNAVGIKGEVRVYNYSDAIDIYEDTPEIYVGEKLLRVEHVRPQKNMVVVKFEGINDRNAAEKCKGTDLFVTEDDLPELPEGEFYVREMIGMTVAHENGDVIGTVRNVITDRAQSLIEVERENAKPALIPYVDQFVLDISKESRLITVRLIDGMLDL